ncbi:MAG: hypothetical protein SVR94_10955 [Pseudomonadota bacterium]|nr:hypothetical protein [Pseudomonadota bacterium]
MKTYGLGFIVLLISVSSFAGSQTGKLKWLDIRAADGLIYFTLMGEAAVNRPPCAKHSYSYWVIKDEQSLTGQQQLQLLNLALMHDKVISVSGFDTCSRWADGEDVNVIRIKP